MSHNLPQRWGCMLIKYSAQKFTELVYLLTDKNSETLESSALGDGRSMFAMFRKVLHNVEGLETETLKLDLVK